LEAAFVCCPPATANPAPARITTAAATAPITKIRFIDNAPFLSSMTLQPDRHDTNCPVKSNEK
jgi:hypothetical protein